MTLQFRSFYRVEISVSVEIDVKFGGPIKKTVLKTFYVANHSASESIAIALVSISETIESPDPWNSNKPETMRVVSKELRACVPEERIPLHVSITLPDGGSGDPAHNHSWGGITVHGDANQPLTEDPLSSLMQEVIRRGNLKLV